MKRIDQDAAGVNTTSKKISADKRPFLKRLEELRQQGRLRAVQFAPRNIREELEAELAILERAKDPPYDAERLKTWVADLNKSIDHQGFKIADDGRKLKWSLYQ